MKPIRIRIHPGLDINKQINEALENLAEQVTDEVALTNKYALPEVPEQFHEFLAALAEGNAESSEKCGWEFHARDIRDVELSSLEEACEEGNYSYLLLTYRDEEHLFLRSSLVKKLSVVPWEGKEEKLVDKYLDPVAINKHGMLFRMPKGKTKTLAKLKPILKRMEMAPWPDSHKNSLVCVTPIKSL